MGLFQSRPKQVAFVGLIGAGKSTILKYFKIQNGIFQYKNTLISGFEFDFTTNKGIRTLWRKYYEQNNKCIVFVIDSSSDDLKLKETCDGLHDFLKDSSLNNPVLILANKQDQCKLDLTQLSNILQISKVKQKVNIKWANAITGKGLDEALDWIWQQINQ